MSEPELDALMARVRNASSRYRAKTELARHLKTTRQQLNDWLTRRFSPGGEITLRLRNWVEEEEAKQKSPDRAETRPEPKTQLRNNAHVKPKSGRINR